MRSVRASSLFVLLFAVQASAQGTTVNAVRGRISERMVVGSTTLGEVLRVVGSPTVSSGTGTMNPVVFDADGDALEDTSTTVSTAGAHTWSAAGSFTSTLGVTGLLSGNTGALLLGTSRLTGTAPEAQWNETDQGTNLKNWRAIVSGSQYAVQALDDSYASLGDLIRGYRRTAADIYGGVGSPDTFEWGQYVRNAVPALNNTLLIGGPVKKIGAVYTSELLADVFTVIEKQVIGNGSFRVGRGTTLTRDLALASTTMFVKDRVFRYLDFGVFQGLGSSGQPQFEAVRIVQAGGADCSEGDADETAGNGTTLPAACGGIDNNDYAISIERNKEQSPSGANDWVSGDGVSATDRYLDIFAWQSAVISGGGAVLGDRPLAYWNFDGPSTTQPNRAAEDGNTTGGGQITALNSTAAGSGGAFSGGDGDNWNRSGLSDAAVFSATVPPMNSGNTQTALSCSMTIEMVYFVHGTTPGSANSVRPVAKWDGSSLSTVTFMVEHYGSGSGGSFVGKMGLLGTPTSGSISNLGPLIQPTAGWHHIVFTYSNVNGGRAYVDGTLTGTPTAALANCMVTNTNDVTGALWGNNGNPFGGTISELAIYPYEFSEEQVDAHNESFQSNRAALSAGPTIVGYERTSDTNWYGVGERWACGNIVGLYGFTQTTYGCGWGDATATYATATASDGFSIWNAGTRKFWADTSGNLSLTGDLTIGTSGVLRSGATSLSVGTGWFLSNGGGIPVFRVGNPSGNFMSWEGTNLLLFSGKVNIDTDGISVDAKTTVGFANDAGYRFNSAYAGQSPSLWMYEDSNGRFMSLDNKTTQSSRTTRIDIGVDDEDSDSAAISINTGTTASSDSAIAITGLTVTLTTNTIKLGSTTTFTGTKVAGACTFTIDRGFITNVTGC